MDVIITNNMNEYKKFICYLKINNKLAEKRKMYLINDKRKVIMENT